nr:unnamed protein product [Haemonchus contortus]
MTCISGYFVLMEELVASGVNIRIFRRRIPNTESLPRLCDSRDSSREPFEYSLDNSLSEVLERPHICCERTPIGWNEDPFFEQVNILDVVKQGYCRCITHFADFVAVIPELNLLEMRDRVTNTLVCRQNLK